MLESSDIDRATISGGIREKLPHDSAHKHVAGEAIYTDDIPEPRGLVHVYLGLSTAAHARITAMDLAAVRAADGVIDVLTADDLPGVNDVAPTGKADDPVFAEGKVWFYGQPVFAVIAETREQARHATALAVITYDPLPALIDLLDDGAPDADFVTEPLKLQIGNVRAGLDKAPRRLSGQMRIGGQDHFYLEGQIALAVPGEDDEMTVYSSTQHPSEVQHMVSHVLSIPSNAVTVEVRRMGGAFGGKETQSNLFAVVAALAARRTGQAAKLRPDRDDDMMATGKRHDFVVDYDIGFNDDGIISAVDMTYSARCGFSADLSGPVTDRALFHLDNCYYFENVHAVTRPVRTNTVSNTAYRGFGGPQGMVAGERLIEEVAYATGLDPVDVRRRNFYGEAPRNVTPYHQTLEDNIIGRIVDELELSSDYAARREAVRAFNAANPVLRKGLALTPVKFGISFTATWYNQAGALVHVYQDGSVHLNHGGTEMGQGLYIKVAQVVADAFQIDRDFVKITATTTAKVPNTSATAASSGTDLNGMAAKNACDQIKARLIAFAAEKYGTEPEKIVFLPHRVKVGALEIPFADLVKAAYMARVQLSAAGFYKTPKVHWDRDAGRGHPFYYFSYGASVSEVTIDTLTGEYQVDRVDILHDVGRPINPAIDIGQVEGGFIQGMGWLTTEELWWDDQGRLRTHAPSTYKIPLASDRPRVFNVDLVDWSSNIEPTINRSKAVGEPPFMLAISVLHALSDAVASVADHRVCPRLDSPATPECILDAVDRLRAEAGE